MNTGNNAVDALARMNFTGNVIPTAWLQKVTFEKSGKADLVSIMILSEIVYWYRPREVRCESTGQVLRYEKRFKADLLQRSYDSFVDQFGISKRQAQNSMKRLEDIGVIKRVFRTVKTSNSVASNVLFIELNIDKLAEITYETTHTEVIAITLESDTLSPLKVTPLTLESDTYTETTTETTTENIYTPPTGDDVSDDQEKKPSRTKRPMVTLQTFLDNCEANGESFIRDYHPVWEYAQSIGLPDDMVVLACEEFIRKFTEEEQGKKKKYADWRLSFKNYVAKGWLGLWYANADGSYKLSTAGVQQARYFKMHDLLLEGEPC